MTEPSEPLSEADRRYRERLQREYRKNLESWLLVPVEDATAEDYAEAERRRWAQRR